MLFKNSNGRLQFIVAQAMFPCAEIAVLHGSLEVVTCKEKGIVRNLSLRNLTLPIRMQGHYCTCPVQSWQGAHVGGTRKRQSNL